VTGWLYLGNLNLSLVRVVSDSNGSDQNDGSPAKPYQTIGRALQDPSGLTIFVLTGLYDGEKLPLVPKDDIRLVGQGVESVTLDGAGKAGKLIRLHGVRSVKISGITFTGQKQQGGSPGAAIVAEATDGSVSVSNVVVADNDVGIEINQGALTVLHATLANNLLHGLRVRDPDFSSSIRDSIVAGSVTGIYGYIGDATAIAQLQSSVAFSDFFNASNAVGQVQIPADPGNLSQDPMFRGPHNYQLKDGSPCVDTADPAGSPDPDGSAPDMGAYGGSLAPSKDAAGPVLDSATAAGLALLLGLGLVLGTSRKLRATRRTC
jgi:uncharacterized protein DUF1565